MLFRLGRLLPGRRSRRTSTKDPPRLGTSSSHWADVEFYCACASVNVGVGVCEVYTSSLGVMWARVVPRFPSRVLSLVLVQSRSAQELLARRDLQDLQGLRRNSKGDRK
jgi:hypothetical protein